MASIYTLLSNRILAANAGSPYTAPIARAVIPPLIDSARRVVTPTPGAAPTLPATNASPPPPLPMQAAPSTPTYSTAPASSAFNDTSGAVNVRAAALQSDPTALTTDAGTTPEAQAANRAKLIQVVGAVVLIWLAFNVLEKGR